jgi:5'-nucleotidase (lipoprotein e(P4) family)
MFESWSDRKNFQWVALSALLAGPVFLTSCASCHQQADSEVFRTQSVLWYQHAAEARALYYQAYNVAHDRLAELADRQRQGKKSAVILDVDETALNNGAFEARGVLENKPFNPADWDDWVREGKAERLPGAVTFVNEAVARGLAVFYITDRSAATAEETMRNLREQGFPMADAEHTLFPAPGEKGKEARRKKVEEAGYEAVLLFGDSLPDFSTEFDGTNSQARAEAVDRAREAFGRKYIILPNPMYGAWERALKNDVPAPGYARKVDWLKIPPPRGN